MQELKKPPIILGAPTPKMGPESGPRVLLPKPGDKIVPEVPGKNSWAETWVSGTCLPLERDWVLVETAASCKFQNPSTNRKQVSQTEKPQLEFSVGSSREICLDSFKNP